MTIAQRHLSGEAKVNLLTNLNKLSQNSGFKISDEFFYINVNNKNINN